jgi:predicted thioesterase
MDHCAISQVCFYERYRVPPEQTARHLFGRLPHGKGYADRMVDAMATGYLVAVLESICARELQPLLDPGEETVVGSSVQCRHRAPIAPNTVLKVDGFVVGIGEREATFYVRASDDHEVVCEGRIRFGIVHKAQMDERIQRKCVPLQPELVA